MPRKNPPKELVPLLRGAIDAFVTRPVILFPFVTVAFIQLVALEILYFAPRFPLAVFFNPIVQTLFGEQFIHYPNNFVVLPKLFQYAQAPIYIFVSSFFIAVAIDVIAAINDGQKINLLSTYRNILKQYVHIFVAATISFCVFYGIHRLYGLLTTRALEIDSTGGIFFIIKTVVLQAAPYVNLFSAAFVAAIFAFVFPLIVIEKKKIFSALLLNFKYLWGSFWFVFALVMMPTLLYVPVLLLRGNIASIAQATFPEVRVLILIVGVLITIFIDAAVYTAITTYYLLKKERS